MVKYEPKEWFSLIFKITKADTFKTLLPLMCYIGLYSAGIVYLETEYWQVAAESFLRNIPVMHTLLGLALSMLLVFRTNTAYERWWEGRKLWGTLVNNSRNLALKIKALLPADHPDIAFFGAMIPNYAFVLKTHLQADSQPANFVETDALSLAELEKEKHQPNRVAFELYQRVHDLHHQKLLTDVHLLYLNPELQSFTEVCGACERIRNTPIPYSYSSFLKKFIFFYVMTLPFGYTFSLGWLVIPVVIFIFYVLVSLEIIAEEIENPFGDDANDLPMDDIAANILGSVTAILK